MQPHLVGTDFGRMLADLEKIVIKDVCVSETKL